MHKFTGSSASALARSIEQAIHSGALGPGDALPPIRQLAASARLSPVTVAAAYRRLRARGLVIADRRRGTRVRPNPASPVVAPDQKPAPAHLVDLATGNPDPALLPPIAAAWAHVDVRPALYGDTPVVAALARFAAGECAADGIDGQHLTIVSGALDGIERLLREHLRGGDRVGVEDPSMPALLDLIGASGFQAVPIGVDAEGPLPDAVAAALADGMRAVIVTPRAQNPTGASVTAERASVLRRVLAPRQDVLVIENDPAGPVAGTPYHGVTAAAIRWAVVRSVSKFLGPDLRLAVMAGDELTIARVQGRLSLGARWVSRLLQQLVLALWSDPSSGRRLAQAADLYAARRGALVEALAAHGIAVTGGSGFNVWVPVREETAAVQGLADRGWAVAAGERFRLRAAPGIRISTASLDPHRAAALAGDIAAAVRASGAATA